MKVGQLVFTDFISITDTDPFSEHIFIATIVEGVDFHGNVIHGVWLQSTDRYINSWENSSAFGQKKRWQIYKQLIL